MNSGGDLKFVPYTKAFLDASYAWFQNKELRRLTFTPPVTKEGQDAFYASLKSRTDYLIWGVERKGEKIGACGLKHVTERDAEYWGYIGDPVLWGRGLGRQLVEACLLQAKARGLKAVYLHVLKENERAVRLYQRCGFIFTDVGRDGLLEMRKNIST